MSSGPEYNELQTIASVAEGNESAFRILYDHYWNRIYTTALAYTKSSPVAREVVQETFIRVWKNREKLPSVENVQAFIFVIARNRIKTCLKEHKKYLSVDEYYILQAPEKDISAERRAGIRQFRDRIYHALDQLPPQQSMVFKLSRFENLSYEEISTRLNISTATVRNHIVKALNFMRDYFAERNTELLIAGVLLLNNF